MELSSKTMWLEEGSYQQKGYRNEIRWHLRRYISSKDY